MSELGDFLRSRRERVTPALVDLPVVGHRRVPGLRREEVALLAGVSVDYYVRLEQGRERFPSAAVLDGLAAALRLDADERTHLFDVAGAAPPLRPAGVVERVDPSLHQLLDAWPHHPALVFDRAYDVLAANRLGTALFGDFSQGRNLVDVVFTEPAARSFYRDWHEVARDAVAGLRLAAGRAPDDLRVRAVIAELQERSEEFAEVWRRHDARGKALASKRFAHPEVGDLTLTMQTFDVRSSPGQELVVYHAEPGSPSADALALLGVSARTRADERADGTTPHASS